MQAYVDLAVCTYARVLQTLHEVCVTCPGTEADSKFYKIMEDCMTFRARLDVAQYIAPGTPCDRLQSPSLPACQSDKTDGIPPTSPPSPPFSPPSPTCSNCAIVQKLEPTSHHITRTCADLLGCPLTICQLARQAVVRYIASREVSLNTVENTREMNSTYEEFKTWRLAAAPDLQDLCRATGYVP